MARARAGFGATGLVIGLALGGCAVAPGVVASEPSGTGPVNCGRVALGQGGPAVPAQQLACFEAGAREGRTTTLVVVRPTTEGDGIVTTYTASDADEVAVVVDATADAFAGTGAGITSQTCRYTVTTTEIELRECTEPTSV